MESEKSFRQAAAVLPPQLRRLAERITDEQKARAEEFRLRTGYPATLLVDAGERAIPGAVPVTEEDLRTVLEIASQASAHTVLERVRNGFVTIRGGHRIGLCGTAVQENGVIRNLRCLSSLAIRIARPVRGIAGTLLSELWEKGTLQNTLILAPPGAGKTTLLRDLIWNLSEGCGGPALRIGVVDERGELAALWEGRPELDLGRQTDVMDSCSKAEGLRMLLRGMNPQVLAVDEITAPEDVEAILQAAGCGVSLLATAHGNSVKDLSLRPVYRRLLESGVFRRVILLKRAPDGSRSAAVEELT